MRKSKIYKILSVTALIGIAAATAVYSQLSPRHKAIVKTTFLFKTGLVSEKWNVENSHQQYKMFSPDFYIDAIYKSMEGPKASNYVQLSQDPDLLWITGFSVKALDAKSGKTISNDFICHTNVDFNDARYFGNFGLDDRIGKHYPRLTSLSHGQENFRFPKGYGVPMKGNDLLYVTTESLNHNIKDANFWVKHQVNIDYEKSGENLKPLMSRTVYIMLPFDAQNPYKQPLDPGQDYCIPVETKNHTYDDGQGGKLSGHWVIPTGKSYWHSEINSQLQIKDSLRLHAAAVHVHPLATSISIYDKTAKKTVFNCAISNHKDRIGLDKVADFNSEAGVWLYADHDYELQLHANNTTSLSQDMMGSMFLFFYDEELHQKLTAGKQ